LLLVFERQGKQKALHDLSKAKEELAAAAARVERLQAEAKANAAVVEQVCGDALSSISFSYRSPN
jgi:uncharacterized protein (UPF0335 family)